MLTLDQRTAMLKAVDDFLEGVREEAETYVGTAYAVGREGINTLAGAEIIDEALDTARVASLVDNNFNLIVSVADQWVAGVQDIVSEGFLNGDSPVDIKGRLSTYFERMPGNWSVIARDQVAKAQLEGRNTTYREIGASQVEVILAPDACGECEPYDGLIVDVDDASNRPQYHVQCACMDVPVLELETPASTQDAEEAQQQSEEADHESGRDSEE